PVFGKIHPTFHTPANALLLNMGIGILALLTGKTAEIITIAVFGALFLYFFSMISLIKLRMIEPELPRPFKVPFYPLFPYTALIITLVALIAMIVFNLVLFLLFFSIMLISVFIFLRLKKNIL
ncbi:MAG: ethanolamine permease, partial [Bacteroidota bacterium]